MFWGERERRMGCSLQGGKLDRERSRSCKMREWMGREREKEREREREREREGGGGVEMSKYYKPYSLPNSVILFFIHLIFSSNILS